MLAIALVVWASAFSGIRAGLGAYTPAHLALLRFLVAGTVLTGYAIVIRIRLPEVRDIPAILLAGFLGIAFYHVLLNTGELTVSAGAASLVANMVPIFTILLAATFLSERLPGGAWVGIGLSTLGVTMIAVGDGSGVKADWGVMLVVVAAMGQAGFFVLQKHYLRRYSAIEFTTYAVWAGTLMLLLFSGGLTEAVRRAPGEATAAVVYLGLFPAAVGYVTWARVLSAWPASKASTALFLIPGFSLAISWIWLSEVPTLFALVGGTLALTGVGLVRKAGCGVRVWGRRLRPDSDSASGAETGRSDDDCGCAGSVPARQPC